MIIDAWHKILNWPKAPNCAKIHHLPINEFKANYYLQPSIAEIVKILAYYLIKQQSYSDKLIVGPPGSGKTTFIYYLKLIEGDGENRLSDKYCFEIIHFNRVVSSNLERSIDAVEERFFKIYSSFLKECGQDKMATAIEMDSTDYNNKINRVIDYIKEKRSTLKKKLIVIIDDIDEVPLSNAEIETLLRHIYTYVETASIEKWLAVRGQTLDHYHESLLSFLKSKFPEKIHFPRVDFYGIVAKRISALGEQAKNPFSQALCGLILNSFNEDIREALGILNKFIEILPPGKLEESTSIEFLSNYFETALPKVFARQKVFPNIFDNSRSSMLPLEKDIFKLLNSRHTVDSYFKASLESHYRITIEVLRLSSIKVINEIKLVSDEEIKGIISYFINNGLLYRLDENSFAYTKRGKVFSHMIKSPLYREECEKELREKNEKKDRMFWILMDVDPSPYDA